MTALLPTTTLTGDAGHAALHNNTNTRINSIMAESLYFSAPMLAIVSGTPVASPTYAAPHWSLGDAATAIVGTTFKVPFGWAAADVFVWTVSPYGISGNVVLQARVIADIQAGDNITSPETTIGQQTIAAPAQHICTRTQLGTAVALAANPEAAITLAAISVRRLGADAADTYAGGFGVVGIELVRTA